MIVEVVGIELAMAKAGIKRRKDLADLIGMTPAQLSRTLNHSTFSSTTLGRLLAALKCQPNDILRCVPTEDEEEL